MTAGSTKCARAIVMTGILGVVRLVATCRRSRQSAQFTKPQPMMAGARCLSSPFIVRRRSARWSAGLIGRGGQVLPAGASTEASVLESVLRPGRGLPVFPIQSRYSAELAHIGGDERQTSGSGMTRQENIVRADHAALGLEPSANTPGFTRGLPVKDLFANRGRQQIDLGQLFRGIGALFNAGVQLVGCDAGNRAVGRRHRSQASQHQRMMAHHSDAGIRIEQVAHDDSQSS